MGQKQMAFLFAAAAVLAGITGCAAHTSPGTVAASLQETAADTDGSREAAAGGETSGSSTNEGDKEDYSTGDASMDNTRNQDGIGDKELLVVSFGTSYNDSRRKTIGAIEDAVEQAFPDFSVRRAFTSQMIIRRVKSRDQVSIDSVGEALERAVDNGVKTLVVQPTHLMNGLEYEELMGELTAYGEAFEEIAVGEPLLTSEEDFRAVIRAITEDTAAYDDGKTAICFMGHGTEADANRVYKKLQEMLRAAGYAHYFVGTVEAEPALKDVVALVRQGSYERVVLQPLMIVAGDHAVNDMAGDEEDSWKSVFEQEGYQVTCVLRGLGELESIRQIFADHARAAMEQPGPGQNAAGTAAGQPEPGQKKAGTMELCYASQFAVDYYQDGSALVTIRDVGRYLVVPEGGQVPRELPEDVTVIRRPLEHIYLAATSAMDLFRSLDGIGQITLSGTDASGWYIPEARQAMEAGNMVYAGKYSAPDYERILAEGCDLAIESTMIFHTPEVKEQLERLGIPVLVERSSYESHPLGRLEWLKLYGLLLGKEDLAEAVLADCLGRLEPVLGQEPAGKTVAFFYMTSNGAVNVRKSGDYLARLIGLAGGTYIPGDLDETGNAQSTMNIQMEAFYQAARDADYLVYSGSIDQAPGNLEEFLAKSPLLADFKAVKEGNVWCTDKDFFQETMGLGEMLLDLNRMMKGAGEDPSGMTYLRRLK